MANAFRPPDENKKSAATTKETAIFIRTFSTAESPSREGARLFERQMASLFSIGLSLDSGKDEPLSTQMQAYCGRSLQFASIRFSPHETSAPATHKDTRRWLVTVQKEGEAHVSQDGRSARVRPGDMVLIDLASPFHIETGHMVTHSTYVDSELLRRVVPDAHLRTARRIETAGGPGAIFRAMNDEMFGMASDLDENTAARIAQALPYTLAVALSLCDKEMTALPSKLHVFHLERIRAFVRDNLHDSSLDAEMISQAVNLSTRHIYQLFTAEQTSLMKWVWSERLERCREDLVSRQLSNRPIGEVAYGWGFSDVAHFSRAFKEKFDMTPREYRKVHG